MNPSEYATATECLYFNNEDLNLLLHYLVIHLESPLFAPIGNTESESSKFPKSSELKLAVCPLNIHKFKFKWSIAFRQTKYKSENL